MKLNTVDLHRKLTQVSHRNLVHQKPSIALPELSVCTLGGDWNVVLETSVKGVVI